MSVLPTSIASSNELSALILELKAYLQWSRHESVKKHVGTSPLSSGPVLSDTTLKLVAEWSKKAPLTQDSLEKIIAALEHIKTHAPVVTITLAAIAPQSLKTVIVQWLRESVHEDVLVSFRANSTILGGMVVRCGSHMFDWSFRRKLLAGGSAFPEVLRRV